MEVKPTGPSLDRTQPSETASGRAGGSRQAAFINTLKDSEADQRHQACANLLEQIDAQSSILKNSATPQGIKRYRQLVAAFMKEALGDSYQLTQECHWDRSGNRKTFVTVKRINQDLEELVDSVVNQEKKQIDRVAKLDEIRGLLLDLYL